MGLPSGAGMEPQDAWVRRLEGRNVVLLFDADVAGRNAALVWFAALDGRASSVKIVQLEDGQDAVTCGDARRAVESALEVPEIVSTVVVDVDGGYVRLGNQPLRLSTWHFQPERLLEQDGIVIGWSGKVAGKRVTITPRDFDGDNFSKWAHSHGLGWQGRKSDGDSILEMLRRGSPFLAKGHATSVVGYHSGHFVMPNRTLGPHGWMHVRGPTGADFEKKVAITPGDVDIGVLKTLTELHAPEVITPVLAWLAAAPLRARLSYFPILAVVGGSGHGKTTLLDACMGAFGWNTHTALTDTTPYAVHALVSGTNAVPVWFDEYRPGARRDSLETLAQVIRGAWDGSEAIKGGLKQNLQELTFIPALAPLVVSGEDTFVETSHRERMVIIDLPLEGRNPDALQGVRSAASEGLGYLYLSWLLEPDTPSGPPNLLALKDRRAVVERVLEWGWMLYTTFAQEMGIRDELPPLTLDLTQSVPKDEPYLTAIEWGLRHFDGAYPLCWEEEGWTYVRTLELTNEILRRGVVMLPGKSRAMMNWLKTNMEGEMARVSNGRAMKIPSDLLTRRLEEINAD